MKKCNLSKIISVKSAELTKLCLNPRYTLLDKEVYQKSCELDELVVEYMRRRNKTGKKTNSS